MFVKVKKNTCIYTDMMILCCSEQISNFQLMRDIGLVSRLLHILKDNKLTQASIDTITSVIHVLLQSPPDNHSLLR